MNNNPIIRRRGVCDPHVHIFDGKAYLYASHDRSIDNDFWYMDDWQIWSSDDLVNWTLESTFRPEDTYIGKSDTCWAVDAAEKNGRYYYYFSNKNTDTGAAVSDSPAGPFRDALGRPILPEELTPSAQYDPTAFVDEDGSAYLIWGIPDGGGYYIAKLNEDMLSLAEEPRSILLDGGLARDDKNFVHKKNGVYYLSWGSNYATSDSVYGPYTTRGTLGVSEDHGSFFSWKGQDFNAFTVFDPTKYFRSTGLCYVHYRANGEMVADQMVAENGVGYYDANWNEIPAVWFMEAEGARKIENVWGGFNAEVQTSGARLAFPGVRNVSDKKRIYFEITSAHDSPTTIEAWDRDRNVLLCECTALPTGRLDHCGYESYWRDADFSGCGEALNLELRFRGGGENLLQLKAMRFI